ncbi:Terminase small subunit [Rhizobium mayense]|uniref:Terminase small subunit n=2 Tax=Rhizobium mayense TaxID=1312184 RepID=A0ABT7JQ03_9HYPH|nr:Terminase small subunit [Rhizobium mayense]
MYNYTPRLADFRARRGQSQPLERSFAMACATDVQTDVGEPASIAYPCPMPALSNQRQEGFCRLISRGEAASRAYGAIYHVTGNNAEAAASRLLRNIKVIDRVAELKGAAAKRTLKTVEILVDQLDEVIVFARQCNNPSAMVAAIAQQAKLLGLEAPRQLEVMHRPAPLPTSVLELSEEEWTAQFSKGPGPRAALTEGAKRLKAEKRKLNGRAPPEPAAIAFDADHEAAAPTVGVIDLG